MSRNNNNKNNNRQQQQYSPTNNPSQGDSFFEQQYQYQQYQYGAPAPASTVYRHHRIASNTSSLGNDDIVNTNDGTEIANLVERGYYNNNNMKSNNPRVRAAPRPQSPLKQQGQPPSRSGTNNTPPNNPRQSSFRRNMREYNANSSTASSSRASFVTFQQNPATVQQPQQQQQQQDEEYYWMRTQKNNSPPRNTRAAAAAAAVTASSTPLLTPSMEVDENENDYEDQDEERISISSRTSSRSGTKEWLYNWKQFAPSPVKHATQFVRWIVVGGSRYTEPQSDKELHQSLAGLARCLHLLRQYLSHYGMPERGGHPDQNHVLREIIRDLYAGGAPLWALEPVMQKAAEGLTGHSDVNWQLYPRKALIYNPSAGTTMFKIERGFNISKMSAMEGVAVRLASFASNANGVANIPARFPNPQEYKRAQRRGSVRDVSYIPEKSVLARKILNLASKQQGLFYFVNSREYLGGKLEPIEDSIKQKQRKRVDNDNHDDDDDDDDIEAFAPPDYDIEDFWIVSDEERELFSRLACLEALKAIAQIDERNNDPERETIYTPLLILICRVTASAGACAFWFNGSLQDMIVAGILAVLVAFIGTTSLLNKQERLVYEVVASFFVGITSGLLALRWPNHFCFAALAISGVLDLLQGFRVVYAIIEIMSKHTVAGGADLLEGILFTGLIAYFLQFGKYVAATIMGVPDDITFGQCTNGISRYWHFLLVPVTTLCWATLFTPIPRDIPVMAFHGVLGYTVNLCLTLAGSTIDLNNFVSATVISLSAGIVSRFTGRQAVGNTVAGIYMLLPGAYLVTSISSGNLDASFFTDIIFRSIIIGIGGWTGTILCSPTLLGTTRGLLWQQSNKTELDMDRHQLQDPPPPPYISGSNSVAGSARHRRMGSVMSHGSSNEQRGGRHHRHESNSVDDEEEEEVPLYPSAHGSDDDGPRYRRRRLKPSSKRVELVERRHHERNESDASFYDFSQPSSTMLFF